ncbi:MAG: dihydrodipicolinate reductase C-terminal domain-containing protein [Bacteroidota bacterium]|nr:dihydrodipicolinate reductase C-terminal domain-containing protein [Bacteroidota bacterium]
MRIAILGNGKMGKKIADLATKGGHNIVAFSDSKNPAVNLDLSKTDVAIDFSTPTAAFENISHALNSGIPIISGTTGWLDRMNEIETLCTTREGAFLYASNFSLGMNLFFEVNKKLASLMNNQDYVCKIQEVHHTEKLDTPSGTAKTLAKNIEEIQRNKIEITADRVENIPGKHTVTYNSTIDEIEIKHTAKNRDGFAKGAILAADWIIGKKGVFSMNDVLGIQ